MLSIQTVTDLIVEKAANQFGKAIVLIEPLGEGLIHRTYKVGYVTGETIVLQCINQHTFPQPENIIHNYRLIQNILQEGSTTGVKIPNLLLTLSGKLFWRDETDNFWRATEFIEGCYAPSLPRNREQAGMAAICFAEYVSALIEADISHFNIVIPSFHDLSYRYDQLEKAIASANIKRLMKSTHLIAELRQRHALVKFYLNMGLNSQFKQRLMHHDCKISNVLFNEETDKVVCPVDLDTTMPGYFFSDLGDLVRTMACTVDENSVQWEKIDVKRDLYKKILQGYSEVIQHVFTKNETDSLHHAGLMLIYMQSIRFLTDFLNNDIYYRTSYDEQNLNRALNQFILLEKLEEFLLGEYKYSPYQS